MLTILWKVKKEIAISLVKNSLLISIVLFLFSQNSYSLGLKGLCFKASTSLDRVLMDMKALALPKDKFFKREAVNCIEVKLSDARFSLYQKYLKRKYLITRTYSGMDTGATRPQGLTGQNCRIEIQKVSSDESTTKQFGLGKKTKLSKSQNSGSRTSTSRLLLASGQKSNMAMDGNSVDLVCWPSSDVTARIVVSLSYDSSRLSTTVSVRKGQKVNLGQIVDKLNDKSRDISLRRGLGYKKTNGQRVSDFFLIYR